MHSLIQQAKMEAPLRNFIHFVRVFLLFMWWTLIMTYKMYSNRKHNFSPS